MKENIETKDVQRTEYLDKNGLDMLWAKVKENTHNQVEVERHRATTQENRIIETKANKSELVNYVTDAALKALEKKVSANTAAISNKQNAGNYLHYETLNNDGYYDIPSVCVINEDNRIATYMASDEIKVNDESLGYTIITTDGVSNKYATDFGFALGFNLNSNGIKLQGGDNNHVLTSNGSTIDITEYAKKTDIPEIGTSDFVSKSDTITQTINSGLIAMDKLQVFSKGYYDQIASLRGGIRVEGADTKFTLIDTTASHNYMELTASKLAMSQQIGDNTLLITTSGIANTDNNADHVYATDGSIADLTQYAKKSEITAGGNVDDVQVNGVSVVENKIANIKSATKESLGVVKVGDGLNVTDGTISVDSTAIGAGNYIPYQRYAHDEYIMLNNICVEGNGTANASSSSIGCNGLSVYKMTNQSIYSNIQCAEIELQSDENRVRINDNGIDIWKLDVHAVDGISDYLLGLSKRGIRLHNGDDNHVLTSNASTIDITQYVLKSVYDEKIAALEARIAALEFVLQHLKTKHAETA